MKYPFTTMNSVLCGIAALCSVLCGCSSAKTDHGAYTDRLESCRRQCIADMDSVLSMPAGGVRSGKIRHGRIIENLAAYDVRDEFIFRGDVVLQIGSGDSSASSDSADVVIYALSYGIDMTAGIVQCDLSCAVKFKLACIDGKTVCDDFRLIDPPELPLTCGECIRGVKWFPYPHFCIEHRPSAPKFFALVKPRYMKITANQDALALQYRFSLQIFSREDECLHQRINRTAMIRRAGADEFDLISEREFDGAWLKMLSDAEIVFEKDLLSINGRGGRFE